MGQPINWLPHLPNSYYTACPFNSRTTKKSKVAPAPKQTEGLSIEPPLPKNEIAYKLAEAAANPHYRRDEYAGWMREGSDAVHALAGWATRAYAVLANAAPTAPVQAAAHDLEKLRKSTPMAYVATDLDGHADVGMSMEEAKRRAGPSCDTIIALHDISTEFVEFEGKAVAAPAQAE
jgi:hypothetical protein